MPCLHPLKTKYRDYRLRKEVSLEVPCGKCPSCLWNFSRGWQFRLSEESRQYKGFIYDTLTVRPSDMPFLDFTDFFDDGALFIPGDYAPDGVPRIREISDESVKLLEHYNGLVPYLHRRIVSDWIKRSRNALNNYRIRHGFPRAKLKYAIVLEYGPKFSRSHCHLVMFGIEYWEYVHFFQSSWNFEFGFTKTKWIEGTDIKSTSNIISYLAKYFTKGSDECPLLKDGILPPPWRLLSHGIGESYLLSPRCQFWRYLGVSRSVWDSARSLSFEGCDPRVFEHFCSIFTAAFDSLNSADLNAFIDVYSTAYSNGYPLSLPRYFRDKIVDSSHRSVLSVVLSSLVLDYNAKRRDLSVASFAGCFLGLSSEEVLLKFANFPSFAASWYHKYRDTERSIAKAANDRIAIKRKNIAVRSSRLNFNTLFEDYEG